jgi:hypothetical protein
MEENAETLPLAGKIVCCFFLSLADDAYSRAGISFGPEINPNPKVT